MHNNGRSYLKSEKIDVSNNRTKKSKSVLEGVKDLQTGVWESGVENKKSGISDIVFLGYQTTPSGKNIPLYNILIKNHPLFNSTVTEDTLRKHNLGVPQVPRAFNKKLEDSDLLK